MASKTRSVTLRDKWDARLALGNRRAKGTRRTCNRCHISGRAAHGIVQRDRHPLAFTCNAACGEERHGTYGSELAHEHDILQYSSESRTAVGQDGTNRSISHAVQRLVQPRVCLELGEVLGIVLDDVVDAHDPVLGIGR